MSDDQITVQGRSITLKSGAQVWGGLHEQSIVWKFTSVERAITTVVLSREAMRAVVDLYQGMIGGDTDFFNVSFEPPSPPQHDGD